MAHAYKPNDPALQDFARWIVGNMLRSHDTLIGLGMELYREHRWPAWAIVATERSQDWQRWRVRQNEADVPRAISGNRSARAAGETIATMLNVGEVEWKARGSDS